MSNENITIACPHCGREAAWKPEYAGRKAQCKCGQVFRYPPEAGGKATAVAAATPKTKPEPKAAAPAAPPAVDGTGAQLRLDRKSEVEAYDVATDESVCPSCLGVMKPEQVICMTCGFNRKTGKKIQTLQATEDQGPTGLRGVLHRLFGAKKKPAVPEKKTPKA
jgi:hypothetical protein